MRHQLLLLLLLVGCNPAPAPLADCHITALDHPTVFHGSSADLTAKVTFPPGDWLIDFSLLWVDATDVQIRGAGIEETTLWADPHLDDHMLSFARPTRVEVSDLTLVGNIATSRLGHCIRGSDTLDFWIHDIEMHDCSSYGIGLQGSGDHIGFTLERVSITNTWLDGFDEKNARQRNHGLRIDDLQVHCAGASIDDQTGIDIRGTGSVLRDITVTGVRGGTSGIRFRQGSDGSTLDQYTIECIDPSSQAIEVLSSSSIGSGSTSGCRF